MDRPGIANDWERERRMYGVMFLLTVAKQLSLWIPVAVYDHGDRIDAGVKVQDLGTEKLIAAQIALSF